MNINKRRGISLIVLVITIIVIIILAGAVILSLASNNPISQAAKATFLSDLRNFETELDLYENQQFLDKMGGYDSTLLQADETSVTYDGVVDNSKTMYDLLPTLGKTAKYAGQFQVVDGKLVFQGSDTNQQNWARESGYEVVILGEPKITIIPPAETVVVQGTDIIYTVKFTSNSPLTTVDLTGKVEVLDNNGVALVTQPNITISTVSGTSLDATRQVDITIKTDSLVNGAYKLKVKSGVVINSNNISNTIDTISLIGFDIDNNPPENPVMSANPSIWTNGNVTVSITYFSDSIVKEYSLDATNWNNYTTSVVVTTNNTTVYARGKDAAGNESGVATLTVANIDKDLPTVIYGTNGATSVQTASTTVTANDVGGSNIDSSKLQYVWDTQNSVAPSDGWTAFTNGEAITKTSATGTYYLWIKVSDNAGNNTLSKTNAFDIDNTAPVNPVMSANPTELTNGDVTVTITYSEDTTIKEYSLNATTWNTYTSGVVVSTNNTTVYARGKDSVGNESGVATLTVANIDKTSPTVAYGTNGGSGETANTTVTVSDVGGSNVNLSTLQYVWDTQNVTTPTSGWTTFTNESIITKTGASGIFYLWIKASDNVGNNVVSKSNEFELATIVAVNKPILATIVAVNKPILATGMTAKKWNSTTSIWDTVTDPDTDTSWYNYGSKKWANAQTADGSMWVWIPRYEYKITTPHSSVAQTIAVNFLINTPTTATSGYTVHPAFTFGSIELTGIWVAKFEASGSITAVDIKPGISSLRNITIDTMFTACRNMETTNGSRYGWGTSGTGIDTHLMKNIEWGVAAYLSQSIYGKNSEIWINANGSYLTGQSGTSVSASAGTTYPYNNLTYGVNASTTGNIYGIYDMSGGINEYTAAYVNNGNGSLTSYGNSLVSAASQYKDVYTSSGDTSSGNYLAASGKKGDAVYETSSSVSTPYNFSWYSDISNMPYSSVPFFSRGGNFSDTNSAGVFNFDSYFGGKASSMLTFRPVLVISAGL